MSDCGEFAGVLTPSCVTALVSSVFVVYIGSDGSLYDELYQPLDSKLENVVEFPQSESFTDYEQFVAALDQWLEEVNESLNGAMLPVNQSRIFLR